MPVFIYDSDMSDALVAERREQGVDKYDEVWNGVYVVSPLANTEHQDLVMAFSNAIAGVWDLKGLGKTQPGANVSDRVEDWMQNYRIPDVLCFTKNTAAIDCSTHWHGGPEFAIEITSRGEEATDKLDFYAEVGTREVLVVERNPWCISLFRFAGTGKGMELAAASTADDPAWIASEIVPIKVQLDWGGKKIQIAGADGGVLRSIGIKVGN